MAVTPTYPGIDIQQAPGAPPPVAAAPANPARSHPRRRVRPHRCVAPNMDSARRVSGHLPDLDANANAIALEHIKVENEGWEWGPSVVEVAET